MAIKHLELFAGIGGFRRAFDLLATDFNFPAKCVGFSEIDSFARKTYASNFDTSSDIDMGNIIEFVRDRDSIRDLPNFDFLTGGFPCQAFSMMGSKKGFKDLRGNVFFQIIDIIKEKKPSFILLENVRNLITHDKGNTIKVVINSLKSAEYENIYFDVFNSADFGLAQTRNRVFIFATNRPLAKNFKFSSMEVKTEFDNILEKTSLLHQEDVLDVLEKKVESKYYLSDTIKPTILSDGSKNFKSKSEINQMIARPLTATMVKMHRACQDNYFSDGFITSRNPKKYLEQSFSKEELYTHNIRKITPKEALLLQGFDQGYYTNAFNAGISNHQLYKQAGNAVSVNTVYAILYYLIFAREVLEIER